MNIIHPKISAAFFAGAAVTVTLGLIAQFNTGFDPSPEWIAGLTTLVAIAAGWLMPTRFADAVITEPVPEEGGAGEPGR